MKTSKNHFPGNLLAVISGISVATLAACGQSPNNNNNINAPAPNNPFQAVQKVGAVPVQDPRTNANNGPIDGEWVRKNTDTNCSSGINTGAYPYPSSTYTPTPTNGGFTTTPTSYSFYIDNNAGSVVITYSNKRVVNIPVTYTYGTASYPSTAYPTTNYPTTAYPTTTYPTTYPTTAGAASGQVQVAKGTGPVLCLDVDSSGNNTVACGGSFVEPNVQMNISYSKYQSNQNQIVFQIDRDLMCNGGASSSTLTIVTN